MAWQEGSRPPQPRGATEPAIMAEPGVMVGPGGHGRAWNHDGTLGSWWDPGVMPGDGTTWGYGRDSRNQGSHVDTAARQDCGLPRRLWPMSTGFGAEPRWLPATNSLIATGP